MRQSYEAVLPPAIVWSKTGDIPMQYTISGALVRQWQSRWATVIEQLFDARHALLYYYEIEAQEAFDVSVNCDLGDVHLLYPLRLDGSSLCFTHAVKPLSLELGKDGFFIYVAPGTYNLHIPAGKHILCGFIIDAGMIRPPASRAYGFLLPLVDAKREQSELPLLSPSFQIGLLAKQALARLFETLRRHELSNEAHIVSYVVYLITLSRLELLYAQGLKQGIESKRLMKHARTLLKETILLVGAKARIADVADNMGISTKKLGRFHQELYGTSFRAYRNKVLLQEVINAIQLYEKLLEAALHCGFSGVSEMRRFIKGQTGKTPGFFKKSFKESNNWI